MKKIILIILFIIGSNIFAQEGAMGGFFTPLGEIGYFGSINPVYFGVGMAIIPVFKEVDSWWDLMARLGGTYVFKNGIGILGGLQYKLLAVDSMGGFSSYDSSGYSGTVQWKYTSVFMPEIGISYQWEKIYGNIMYQFDTVNIKNSTICITLGVLYGK